jgi:excisionase family DNA binding protein
MTAFDDDYMGEPHMSLSDIAEALASPVTEIPSIAREWSDATSKREAATAAAAQLLAETAEAITPDTGPAELLDCLTRYRAHLAALVTATSLRAPLVRTVEETAAALAVSPFTVYQMIHRAELLTYRVAKRCIRIDELALRDYLADREVIPLGPHKLTGYDIPRRQLPEHLQ